MAQHIVKITTNAEATCIWVTEQYPGTNYSSGWEPFHSRICQSLMTHLTEEQISFLKATPHGLLKIVDGVEIERVDWRER